MKQLLLIALPALLLCGSCKKENACSSGEVLLNAMQDNNIQAAGTVITVYINQLPSQNYTSQNLDRLVDVINRSCGLTARKICFSCIKTLPEQSEIEVASTNSSLKKVFDISFTAGNEMVFRNMHE